MSKLRKLKSVIYILLLILLRSLKITARLISVKPVHQNLYIKWWFGELGNNLIQLAHAEYLSEKLNLQIHTLSHKFLDLDSRYERIDDKLIDDPHKSDRLANEPILLYEMKSAESSNPEVKKSFLRGYFYMYDILPLGLNLKKYRNILREKILPLIPYQVDPEIDEETLVIHIRSGDIFADYGVHSGYVQPPFSFYLEIVNKFQFKKIVIVTQPDRKNPCIEELHRLLPNVRIQTGSLIEDVSTILSARHLVTGLSSFSLTLAFCSRNIRNLYIPQFDLKSTYLRVIFWPKLMQIFLNSTRIDERLSAGLDFNICPIKIKNYIAIGTWKNTPEQRQLMLAKNNVSS